MNGEIAMIFFLGGLANAATDSCHERCFTLTDAKPAIYLRGAEQFFNGGDITEEVVVEFDPGWRRGALRPRIGIGIDALRASWAGLGASWQLARDNLFVEAAFMPGWQLPTDSSPDLGGKLQFRSSLGVGYTFDNGISIALVVDHRSNGDTQEVNPGLETVGLRFGYTFD
jgi:lipid A 3-O-deacylase